MVVVALASAVGFLDVCLCVGACGVEASAGLVMDVEGSAGGGGLLPGKGVPLLILNQVSPVHVAPVKTLFCCCLLRSWFASTKSSLLLSARASVVFQPVCWNWTLLVRHEKCFALCAVYSY